MGWFESAIAGIMKLAGVKSIFYTVTTWAPHYHRAFIIVLAILFIAFVIFCIHQIIKIPKQPPSEGSK